MRLLILSCLLLLSSFATANTGWQLKKDEAGIQIFLRNTPGSAIRSFKGTMTVKRSLSSIAAVIDDIDSYPRWSHNCKSAKRLQKTNDRQSLNYLVIDMPWPVIDRDAVVAATRTQNKSNKHIEFKLQAKPKSASQVAGKVRIEKMQGRWLLTPVGKDQVNVSYEMVVDPGGNIPKWLVNSLAVDIPFHTLANLRKVSAEGKYATAKLNGVID